MTIQQIKSIAQTVLISLTSGRISESLVHLAAMTQAASAPWELRREAEIVASNYKLLAGYALDGMVDPNRKSMVAEIKSKIRSIVAATVRYASMEESPSLYFSTLRYESRQNNETIAMLIERYKELLSKLSLAILGGKKDVDTGDGDTVRHRAETLSARIFRKVWVTSPLSAEDVSAIEGVLGDSAVSSVFRKQLISAVMLGGMQYFDDKRIAILGKAYLSDEQELSVRALCSLLLLLWTGRNYSQSVNTRAILAQVADSPRWASDVRMAFMQLIRARDTERITKKMNEEVIPSMMKMKSDIKKFSEMENPEDLLSLDENPEWEEFLHETGLDKQIKELTELQSDGGDVMMSTFSHLKTFAFFNEIGNWFLPFDALHTELPTVSGHGASEYFEIVRTSTMLCDSDKYSMVLSLANVPKSARNMMFSQMSAQNVSLAELMSTEVNDDVKRRELEANNYVHDIYRFFKLFRRKSEFSDPFSKPINLASLEYLAPVLNDGATLSVVAEFYFKRGYYAEALELFERLIEQDPLSGAYYQKAGYCKQQLGDIDGALDLYRKGELMSPDSTWLMRRIATCSKLIGNIDDATKYFKMLIDKNPDDLKAEINLGHCYMELGEYKEALQSYHKVEFISGAMPKTVRPIAWCAFLSGDYEKSRHYYAKIPKESLSVSDYLNIGHLEMATGNYRKAEELYKNVLKAEDNNVEGFLKHFDGDRHYLEDAGVDETMIDLMRDQVSGSVWN